MLAKALQVTCPGSYKTDCGKSRTRLASPNSSPYSQSTRSQLPYNHIIIVLPFFSEAVNAFAQGSHISQLLKHRLPLLLGTISHFCRSSLQGRHCNLRHLNMTVYRSTWWSAVVTPHTSHYVFPVHPATNTNYKVYLQHLVPIAIPE